MAFGEVVKADEAEKFRGFAEEIAAIQRERAAARGYVSRVAHLKQHLGVVGELLTEPDENARFGVFATAGKRFPVYVRFSNSSGLIQGDGAPDVRGLALKIVGVPGPKLIHGMEGELTQDFLFISTPTIPFSDPDGFMTFLRAAKDGPAKLLPRLVSSIGLGPALKTLWGALTAKRVESFATHTFHTAAPVAFGSSAAKLALFPYDADAPAPEVSGADHLREDLTTRLRSDALRWSLRAQLFVDETLTPIEDTSVEWEGPWVELGRLKLPKQDPETALGKEIGELVNQLSFDPWHAIEAHRPLGAVMRARKVAYAPSVSGRKAVAEPREMPYLDMIA